MFYTKAINEMKAAIQSYDSALASFLTTVREARAVYNEIALMQHVKDQQAKLTEVRNSVIDRIHTAASDLKSVITQLWTPNERNYNPGYMAMLEDIPVTLQDLEDAARERFSDNPTMLMALRTYAERKNLAEGNVFAPTSPLKFASKTELLSAVDILEHELHGVLAWNDEAHSQALHYAATHFETAFKSAKPFIQPE